MKRKKGGGKRIRRVFVRAKGQHARDADEERFFLY